MWWLDWHSFYFLLFSALLWRTRTQRGSMSASAPVLGGVINIVLVPNSGFSKDISSDILRLIIFLNLRYCGSHYAYTKIHHSTQGKNNWGHRSPVTRCLIKTRPWSLPCDHDLRILAGYHRLKKLPLSLPPHSCHGSMQHSKHLMQSSVEFARPRATQFTHHTRCTGCNCAVVCALTYNKCITPVVLFFSSVYESFELTLWLNCRHKAYQFSLKR